MQKSSLTYELSITALASCDVFLPWRIIVYDYLKVKKSHFNYLIDKLYFLQLYHVMFHDVFHMQCQI